MKKQETLEFVRASLTMQEADWNAFRAFRSSIDWLPAEVVTPFVEKHVSRTDGATLASMLRRGRARGAADRVDAHVHLDAEAADAITIGVSRHVASADGSLPTLRTNLDGLVLEPDQLGLGPLGSLEDLPDYAAHAARRMQIAWFWDEASIRTKLRGKKREGVRAWISSGKSAAK